MPSPEQSPDESQAKHKSKPESIKQSGDFDTTNTVHDKVVDEAYDLLEQSQSVQPSGVGKLGQESRGELAKDTVKTNELISNGQLSVPDLWFGDQVNDPGQSLAFQGGQEKDQGQNGKPVPTGQEKGQEQAEKPAEKSIPAGQEKDKEQTEKPLPVGQPKHEAQTEKPDNKPYLENTQPTEEEIDFLKPSLPISPELEQKLGEVLAAIEKEQKELWKNVKELVNKIGRTPHDALIEAKKASRVRVLGIGEIHTFGVNPERDFGAGVMKDLHDQGGATHFAVEFPKILQPVLDKFNNDPQKGELEIPEKIIGADGKEDTSIEAKGALEFLKSIKEKAPDLVKLFTAARDAGK